MVNFPLQSAHVSSAQAALRLHGDSILQKNGREVKKTQSCGSDTQGTIPSIIIQNVHSVWLPLYWLRSWANRMSIRLLQTKSGLAIKPFHALLFSVLLSPFVHVTAYFRNNHTKVNGYLHEFLARTKNKEWSGTTLTYLLIARTLLQRADRA
jgi:hypothetical protein